MFIPWLSIFIWLPTGLALLCLLCPTRGVLAWRLAAGGLIALCVGAGYLLLGLNKQLIPAGTFEGYAWVEQYSWFRLHLGENSFDVDYLLGVDGISLPLIALSVFVFLIGLVTAYTQARRPSKYFLAGYLFLLSMVLGVLCSLDLLLFFIFFELVALPIYLLIATYGGDGRANAAGQFLLYSLVGSVLFLLVVLGIYSSLNPALEGSIHLGLLFNPEVYAPDGLLSPYLRTTQWSTVAFIALLVSFAIKLAIVPCHGWLPYAHVEASTPVSIVLAGVVLKLGGYALLRVGWSIFHEHLLQNGDVLMWIGGGTIVYGALNALAQQDMKRMIAYSSIGHMGFVWLGIMSSMENSLVGAVYQMI